MRVKEEMIYQWIDQILNLAINSLVDFLELTKKKDPHNLLSFYIKHPCHSSTPP